MQEFTQMWQMSHVLVEQGPSLLASARAGEHCKYTICSPYNHQMEDNVGTVHVLCVFTITKCICCFDSKIKSLMTRNWLSIKGIIFTFWSNYSYLCYWYHTLQESFRNQKSLLVFVCLNNCIYIVLTIGKFKIISTEIWG